MNCIRVPTHDVPHAGVLSESIYAKRSHARSANYMPTKTKISNKDIKLALKWVNNELSYQNVSLALGYKTYKSGSPYVKLALALKEHINKINQKK